jgi:hypothetical protein
MRTKTRIAALIAVLGIGLLAAASSAEARSNCTTQRTGSTAINGAVIPCYTTTCTQVKCIIIGPNREKECYTTLPEVTTQCQLSIPKAQ